MNKRIDNAKKIFPKYRIGSCIVSRPSHIRYLTGLKAMEKGDAFFLILRNCSFLVTDFRYEEEAFALVNALRSFRVIIPEGSWPKMREVTRLLKKNKRIGFDSELDFFFYDQLQKALAGRMVPVGGLIDEISAIKDASEIAKIKKALTITETVFEKKILPIIKPGIRELDLAAEISYWQRKEGAEGDAFPSIVLAGARSSLPHGLPGVRRVKKGDIVQFDIGCVVDGYHSDFSRVVFVGPKPNRKQKEIYEIVRAANEMAIDACRPGMFYGELDDVARFHIISKGYGTYFRHSLGHGVGIEIHVLPSVRAGNSEKMLPGHVLTIEPGIYIPGWGGIRIEDMILATDSGAEVLTKFTKEIICV